MRLHSFYYLCAYFLIFEAYLNLCFQCCVYDLPSSGLYAKFLLAVERILTYSLSLHTKCSTLIYVIYMSKREGEIL